MSHTPEETKELYKLIGNYERFSETITADLHDIKSRLEQGDLRFTEVGNKCIEFTGKIADHEKRLTAFEENGIPTRVKHQINGTSIATIGLVIYEVIKRFLGWL